MTRENVRRSVIGFNQSNILVDVTIGRTDTRGTGASVLTLFWHTTMGTRYCNVATMRRGVMGLVQFNVVKNG